jgi:hypothetical protein
VPCETVYWIRIYTSYHNYKLFYINLHTAKLLHDTAYLAISYWKMVSSLLGTSEGSIVNVRRPDGVGILFELSLSGRRLLRRARLIQKMLSDGELLIILRCEMNFDRDQTAAAIDCLITSALYRSDQLCHLHRLLCSGPSSSSSSSRSVLRQNLSQSEFSMYCDLVRLPSLTSTSSFP